ncbi:PX domain-containing protein kinase-like protein isoform X2 [Gigantopelta aegis]|uniref:PX domain-containing protein kinase-like protein isoform X2 n=1 Tax=Gigantopelta aegis TaxID=1735272 RepID=UPI001B88E427|nr:PX domain-containing protein kinase-like protein isoform X2 [Gigantopelta aegis]
MEEREEEREIKEIRWREEYVIRVQRGPLKDNSWQLTKRYSDFDNLVAQLKGYGMELPIPPKKVFGNFDREFVAVRQKGLQNLLHLIMSQHLLSESIIVKRFLDPKTYSANFLEMALQHVSMLFRSEPNWDVVEPFPDCGWRLRKAHILIRPIAQPKVRQMLSWCDFGPDKTIPEKELSALMKFLPTIQHPFLHPILYATTNETGGMVTRSFNENGSLRDIICKCKPKGHFMKKYSLSKAPSGLDVQCIKTYGKQILEALKYMQDKGFPYGHLHAGNVFVEKNVCRLTELENWLLGVPSYYRVYVTEFKKIQTTEQIDVYTFGHLLYEMVLGYQLNAPSCDSFPPSCPAQIRSVLESILTTEACKNGLPTVGDLLQHALFSDVTFGLMDKPQFKVPSKLKECVRVARDSMELRLKEEQKLISKVKRLSKAKEFHMSEEEKKKRRKSRKKALENGDPLEPTSPVSPMSPTTPTTPSTPMSPTSPLPASPESTTTTSTTASPAPPPPPAAPPISIPPPPPPSGAAPSSVAPVEGRGALLGSIAGFSKGALRKTTTVDKSGPKV